MWFVSHLRRACSPAWIARAVDWIPLRLRPCKSFFDWKRTHFDAFRPFGRKLIKWKRWLKISLGHLFLLTCIEFNWRHNVQFYRCRTFKCWKSKTRQNVIADGNRCVFDGNENASFWKRILFSFCEQGLNPSLAPFVVIMSSAALCSFFLRCICP